MERIEDKLRALKGYTEFFRQGPPRYDYQPSKSLEQDFLKLIRAIGGIDFENKHHKRIKNTILNPNSNSEKLRKKSEKAFDRGDLQLGTLYHLIGTSVFNPEMTFREIIEQLKGKIDVAGAYYLNFQTKHELNPENLEKAIFLDFDSTITDLTQEDNIRKDVFNFLKKHEENKKYLHLVTSSGLDIIKKMQGSLRKEYYEKIIRYLDAVFAIPGIVMKNLSGKLYGGLIDYLKLKPEKCIIIGDSLGADRPCDKFYEKRIVQLVTTEGISANKWTQTIRLLELLSEGQGLSHAIRKIKKQTAKVVKDTKFVKYNLYDLLRKDRIFLGEDRIVDLYGHPYYKNALIMGKKSSEVKFPTQ